MKTSSNQTPTITRAFIYLSIFIGGLVVIALLHHFIEFVPRAPLSAILTLIIIVIFILIGAIFACEHHLQSRTSSAATLFVLSIISLYIGRSFIPDAYLLAVAFCVAILGAQPLFHRKLATLKQAILYNLLIIVMAFGVSITLASGIMMFDRSVTQQQHYSHN